MLRPRHTRANCSARRARIWVACRCQDREDTLTRNRLALAGTDDADYARIGITRDRIEPWEDAARTDGRPGTYEWWYLDAKFDDGATLVVGLYTKQYSAPEGALSPWVRVTLDLADGRRFDRTATFSQSEYSAATDRLDVRIGGNRLHGDLHSCHLVAQIDDLALDLTLIGDVPAWRPATGHMFFGSDRSRHFAWLPSIPQGTVTARYTIDGEAHEDTGVGYHDHNWGNVPLGRVIHHWYWARGHAGPYSVIASHITSQRRYGYVSAPVFMLARHGEIVAGDSARATFEGSGPYSDASTGKPVYATTRYVYEEAGQLYAVTFTRETDLARDRLVETLHGPKRLAARLIGFDGAYLRFSGRIRIQHFHDGRLIDEFANDALWELMYLGRNRED